ncbi:hypothetical protein [Chengkuizengella marina]|uniref:hypothetical protein n=1 Tax=Chengkuizengella marina TaxID=2507566 RepID=UPI00136CED2C|nr:hypothetical protein [Chengkuizengella marina]
MITDLECVCIENSTTSKFKIVNTSLVVGTVTGEGVETISSSTTGITTRRAPTFDF